METRAGKEKCFKCSVFVLKKKVVQDCWKRWYWRFPLISHAKKKELFTRVLGIWNVFGMCKPSTAHTHTEPNSFFMAISHQTTLKSVAKLHLQKSPFCKILKGEAGGDRRERRRNIYTSVMISLHIFQNHSTKTGRHLNSNILLSCSSNWACLGKHASFPDFIL